MSSRSTSNPRLRVLILALAVAALALMATAASAAAASATGELVLTLKKGAKSSLLREGVKVSPRQGGGKTQTVKLNVDDLALGGKSVLSSPNTLTFAAQGKRAKFRSLVAETGAKSTAIKGTLGKLTMVVFRASGTPGADASSLRVNGPLSLTGNAAKALRGKLGLAGITAGRVGGFKANAAVIPPPPVTPEEKPNVDPYPYAAQCPVAAGSGTGSFAKAPEAVGGIAALPVFAAGTSQPLTAGEAQWGFSTSFRGYVLGAPPAGNLQTFEGATASAEGMGMAAPGAYFGFGSGSGDYEAGTEPDHSDDKLVVQGAGTVLFCKSGHFFSIALKNPAVIIDGAESRITAEVGANMNGTWYPFQKIDLAELDVAGIEPEVLDSGSTLAWEDVPATLTADGSKALGQIYKAGTALDPVSVEAGLDRPLLTQCTIASGAAETLPAVSFGLTALPTLSSPVSAEGGNLGTIDWGVRRATRNSVAGAGGSFPLLGGATESYPGNMGGAAGAPPAGGTGKFFRFPISSYEYEAGTADPKDDRLIATSDATVGFCNPSLGNFGIVISKPTLVIDGASSRLIANAYSFGGGFPSPSPQGWIGGRVELVDLDTSAVEAINAGGTVNWGDTPAGEEPIVNGIPVTGGWQTNALALANLNEGTGSGGFDPVTAQIVLPEP